jgi:hypothetical protein
MDNDIWQRRNQIMRERSDKQRELMREYDQTFYRPALAKLVEDCGNLEGGHDHGRWHDNGWGVGGWICSRCQTWHSKENYNIRDE